MADLLGKSEQFAPFGGSGSPGEEERPGWGLAGKDRDTTRGSEEWSVGCRPTLGRAVLAPGHSSGKHRRPSASGRPRPTMTSRSHRETHCILSRHFARQGAIQVLILPTDPLYGFFRPAQRAPRIWYSIHLPCLLSHLYPGTFQQLKKKKFFLWYLVSEE